MKKPELLAPAGSFDSLKASIQAGCDAVYLGGELFGARAQAKNLSMDDLLYAIDYVHRYDKKLYLTVNTLLKEAELRDSLAAFLQPVYRQGLDAVIVQDTGVLRFISEIFPELPVHLSTQMTINTADAANFYMNSSAGKNITRFVPSRELSLAELAEMKKKTPLEMEVFIHGALCYCYSGQCLMSSMIGGRSGNRGRCAQPCRMAYQCETVSGRRVKAAGDYLLSPKDICTLELIPDLMAIGIDSFKIEGRMKRFEYAAGVTSVYREVIDRCMELGLDGYREYCANHPQDLMKEQKKLMELYNRGGFSQGYIKEKQGSEMMSMVRPNHNGIKVGTVQSITGISAEILLEEAVSWQDVLEIRNDDENALYEFTVGNGAKEGQLYITNVKPKSGVMQGQSVYRTKNDALLKDIEEKYSNSEKKLPIKGHVIAITGRPIRLTLHYNDSTCVVDGDVLQEAQNRPVTEEDIQKQMYKTKDSPFEFELLEITLEGSGFIPVSKLNELRRNGLDKLEKTIVERFRREDWPLQKSVKPDQYTKDSRYDEEYQSYAADCPLPGFLVRISSQEQLLPVIENSFTDIVVLDISDMTLDQAVAMAAACAENKKRCYLGMPRILRENGMQVIRQYETLLLSDMIDGVMLRNTEEVAYIESLNWKKTIILDSMLYVTNKQSKRFWYENGSFLLTASLELNNDELQELGCEDLILQIYGRIPLMVSAQCLNHNTIGCRGGKDGEEVMLTDRMGKHFPVKTYCRGCYSVLYNSENYSLLSHKDEVMNLHPKQLFLDFVFESKEEVQMTLSMASDAYFEDSQNKSRKTGWTTKGHFHRGVQ